MPAGFEPNGPGEPRSESTYCTDAVISRPPAPSQPRLAPPCERRLSSFVTSVPSAGARPVKPSSRWCDSDAAPCQRAPPALTVAAPLRAARPPASAKAVPTTGPPRAVTIWMTPPIASEPYSALCGPRTTSTRAASATGTCERSRPPPKALARTPSTSTRVKSDSPPRGKTEVTVPGPPLRATAKPGTRRSASPSVSVCRASRSSRVSTLTLEPASESGVSTCDAVTVSTSLTARTASVSSRSVRPVSTREGVASIPGAKARSVTVPAGRSRRKRPSAPVVVVTGAASGPEAITVAPATG